MELYKALCEISGEGNVLKDEPMKMHTTFRIGGPADYFIQPSKIEEIRRIVAVCRECSTPYYIMGNGSNLLVGDKGFRGVIVQVFKQMSDVYADGERVYAQAGTLGGALRMNAGAYGGEMKQIVESAEVLTSEGEVLNLTNEELGMGYRTSVIAKNDYVALSAVLKLEKGDRQEIRAYMEDLKERRVTKQPLEFGSAGSTFKRPEGYFAGKLIQDSGMQGYRVGDAQVSEKHCGFVINRGNATAAEVMQLMKDVADRVEEKFGVRLEPEVRRIGEF